MFSPEVLRQKFLGCKKLWFKCLQKDSEHFSPEDKVPSFTDPVANSSCIMVIVDFAIIIFKVYIL